MHDIWYDTPQGWVEVRAWGCPKPGDLLTMESMEEPWLEVTQGGLCVQEYDWQNTAVTIPGTNCWEARRIP